jgi:hypothetical protein
MYFRLRSTERKHKQGSRSKNGKGLLSALQTRGLLHGANLLRKTYVYSNEESGAFAIGKGCFQGLLRRDFVPQKALS